ncbi:MAG: HEAT repeat domain-containing protein [Bryobacteraceae bacterium]
MAVRYIPGHQPAAPQPPRESQGVASAIAPPTSLDDAFRQLERLEVALAESRLHEGDPAIEEVVPRDVAGAALYWLSNYNRNPADAARKIRELAAQAPQQVAESVLSHYDPERWPGATPFIERLLSGLGETVKTLCNPSLSMDDSVRIARTLGQYDPPFDVRFAKRLLDDDLTTEAERQRGLAILDKLGSVGRMIPILVQFLRSPDSQVRSKTALMFGQTLPSHGITERLMRDGDARVRANFIEGLWNCTTRDFRPLFRQAVEDSHHRVAGNAVIGLYRQGEIHEAIGHLSKMARHPEAAFRVTAAWLMGQIGDEHFTGVLRHMANDSDPLVRNKATDSLRAINPAASEP